MLDESNSKKILMEIVSLLKVYKAFDSKGEIKLRRLGKDYDGGYVVPEIALEQADAIMGYGIGPDNSFEESASIIYGKPSYGFDGTVMFNRPSHPLFHFVPLCIKSESQANYSNEKTHFSEHLKMFDLQGKKVFIKMDIEEDEYTTMPDILKYSDYITGISFELHFPCDTILEALTLLKQFEKDFVLVHVHGHNRSDTFSVPNADGAVPKLLELSYINRKLLDRFELSSDQSHPTDLDMPCTEGYPEAHFTIHL